MATMAEMQAEVLRIWNGSFQTELDEALATRLRAGALCGVQAALEQALCEELELHLGFERYARNADGAKPPEQQRSGFFVRRVGTTFGEIATLRVPKLRRGNKDRKWRILVRYQRARQLLLDKLFYLYMLGLSLRDLAEGLYVWLGMVLSRSAINRITTAVQDATTQWIQAPLTETPPVLIVDGVWVQILYPTGTKWVDQSGHTRQQTRGAERVILAVMAVWPDGHYHLLHYAVAETENEATWGQVLAHLCTRGLDPTQVQVVVSDGTKGLLSALRVHLPQTQQQRCTAHKVRGFERHLQYTNLPTTDQANGQALSPEQARAQRQHAITTEAHAIFAAPTQAEAQQRLTQWRQTWEPLEPAAVRNFTWGLQRCFTFYQLPRSLHPHTRTTNRLERFFREFRAKADEIGAFPNEPSCLTIFHFVMIREHAKHNRCDFAKT